MREGERDRRRRRKKKRRSQSDSPSYSNPQQYHHVPTFPGLLFVQGRDMS